VHTAVKAQLAFSSPLLFSSLLSFLPFSVLHIRIFVMSTSTKYEPNEQENSRLRIGSRDKNVGWFNSDLETLTSAQRGLFENYSRIHPDRVIPHILEVVRASFPVAIPLFNLRFIARESLGIPSLTLHWTTTIYRLRSFAVSFVPRNPITYQIGGEFVRPRVLLRSRLTKACL
jgi:hypothetical protein